MRLGILSIYDKELLKKFGIKAAIVLRVQRSLSMDATEITLIHPGLIDLPEGSHPPHILLEDIQ